MVLARLLGATLALGGCSGVEVLGDRPPSSCDFADYDLQATGRQQRIEIATFWATEAESAAFRVLARAVNSKAYVISTTDRRDRDHQQSSLKDWLVQDSDPLPDAFQVNGGSDVLQWVDAESPEEAQVCPLTELDERYGFSDLFFPAALDTVTCKGTLYGLPVGVHRLNLLFYNRTLFDRLKEEAKAQKLSLKRPEELADVDELRAQLETIASLESKTPSGDLIVPLLLDTADTWPLAVFTYENLLVARSSEAYRTLWQGGGGGDRAPALRSALERMVDDLRGLAAYSNYVEPYRAVAELTTGGAVRWQDALRRVGAGEALYTVMGDWGWAHLAEARDAVEAIPFPGTQRAFVYTPDSFAVPRRTGSDGSGAHLWLREVVANVSTQIAFARAKHSIPAFTELSEEQLDALDNPRLAETHRAFSRCHEDDSDCELLLAVSGLGPSPAADGCFDEVGWLLARTLGSISQPEAAAEEAGELRACARPLPRNPRAAGEELIERLMIVSRTYFAEACR